MKNKTILTRTYLFILSLLFLTTANAQLGWQDGEGLRFGVRAGFGMSTLGGIDGLTYLPGTEYTSTAYTAALRPSWDIGVALQLSYKDGLFSQTDMFYSKMGTNLKNANVMTEGGREYVVRRINIDYLTVDQYVGKKIWISDFTSLVLAGGGYMGFEVGNIFDLNNDTYKSDEWYIYNFSQKGMNSYLADFDILDMGLSVMAGFETKKTQVSFNYNYGLWKLVNTSHYLTRNRVGKIVFTYFF